MSKKKKKRKSKKKVIKKTLRKKKSKRNSKKKITRKNLRLNLKNLLIKFTKQSQNGPKMRWRINQCMKKNTKSL